ncbi:MAG: radical SAM protein [Candidatus Hermodarchaeota archaeon]
MSPNNRVALIEITTNCNLKCTHCFANKSSDKVLNLSQIKDILEKLPSYNVKDLILYGGEPFLRKDIFEIIKYAKNCGIENIGITTNGLMLEEKSIIREIRKYLDIIVQLVIGVNGASSDTHDFIRGKGQFEHLMRILRSRSVRKLPLGIDACIGKWNFHEIDEFFNIALSFNGNFFNFVPFVPLGEGKNLMNQVLDPLECQQMLEILHEKQIEGEFVDTCIMPYAKVISNDLTGCCNLLTEFITINASGDLIPCIYLMDYNLGSVLNHDLDALYSNPKANYFIDLNKFKSELNGPCKECPHFELCGGGCKMVSQAIKGSIFESDPLCPFNNQ